MAIIQVNSQILNSKIMQSLSPMQTLNWFKKFPYPNCQRVSSMSDLRSGIAVAETLMQIVPETYHSTLLARIEVNNLNSDTCIANWRTIKQVLAIYISIQVQHGEMENKMSKFTGEGFYYRQQDLLKFVKEILIVLWEKKLNSKENAKQNKQTKYKSFSYSNTIMAHLLDQQQNDKQRENKKSSKRVPNKIPPKQAKPSQKMSQNINLSQLSDIANCSYPQADPDQQQDTRQADPKNITIVNKFSCQEQNQFLDEEGEQENKCNMLSPPQWIEAKENLSIWLGEKVPSFYLYQPHQMLGHLVNNVFCASRMQNIVIKNAHFQHGAIFVYRKLLQFLLQNKNSERISKTNALYVMKSIEQQGVVRETQYWKLVFDIYMYDTNKNKNYHNTNLIQLSLNQKANPETQNLKGRTSRPKPQHAQSKQSKQNVPWSINRKNSSKSLSKCKTSKQSLHTQATHDVNKYGNIFLPHLKELSAQQVHKVQKWLKEDLGLEHSYSKIYQTDIYANPLINGNIVTTILMRLKIGKPIINKYPINIEHLRNNWQQINKIGSLRGYQIFKKASSVMISSSSQTMTKNINQLVRFLLFILNQFHTEYSLKNPAQKQSPRNPNPSSCQSCPVPTSLSMSPKSHTELCKYLQQKFSICLNPTYLSTQQLTSACHQLLNIPMYRQTTTKIQANNVEKILLKFRNMGLSQFYGMRAGQVLGLDDRIRWDILHTVYSIIQAGIVFIQ